MTWGESINFTSRELHTLWSQKQSASLWQTNIISPLLHLAPSLTFSTSTSCIRFTICLNLRCMNSGTLFFLDLGMELKWGFYSEIQHVIIGSSLDTLKWKWDHSKLQLLDSNGYVLHLKWPYLSGRLISEKRMISLTLSFALLRLIGWG